MISKTRFYFLIEASLNMLSHNFYFRDQLDHRGRYGREDPSLKGRGDWDQEYNDHDWDRNRRQMEWDSRENWDSMDHKQIDEEWRHYNRSMDNWPNDDRRRWGAADWRERERSRPRSVTSHHMDTMNGKSVFS